MATPARQRKGRGLISSALNKAIDLLPVELNLLLIRIVGRVRI